MNMEWILGGIFCGGSIMEDSGIDSAVDSDLDLMMGSGVNSGWDALWRIFYGGFCH